MAKKLKSCRRIQMCDTCDGCKSRALSLNGMGERISRLMGRRSEGAWLGGQGLDGFMGFDVQDWVRGGEGSDFRDIDCARMR